MLWRRHLPLPPAPGRSVAVFSRRDLVDEVAPPPAPGGDTLVRLS